MKLLCPYLVLTLSETNSIKHPEEKPLSPKPCRYYAIYFTVSKMKKSEAKQQRVFKQNKTRACQKMLRTSVDYNSSTKTKDIA